MRARLLALALLALAGCGGGKEEAVPQAAPAGPRLLLKASEVSDWQDVSGEIATVDQAQIIARIPGILSALSVREGDVVMKGQVIGRVVDSQLAPQAGAFAAQAAAAQAQAAQAQAELDRARFLYDNGVYAKARLDAARAAAATASAQVRAARAQQSAVGALAGQGALVAPANGRVLRTDIPAGAPVAPGMVVALVTAGPTVLRLELPESLAEKVGPGARVLASGIGGGEAVGIVSRVYPSVATGQVTADVAMPGIEGGLIGRRIAARVEAGRRRALLVPSSFVVRRYGIDYVTVLGKDKAASQVPVQTAPSAERGKLEILSGVSAGDTLVAPKAAAGAQ